MLSLKWASSLTQVPTASVEFWGSICKLVVGLEGLRDLVSGSRVAEQPSYVPSKRYQTRSLNLEVCLKDPEIGTVVSLCPGPSDLEAYKIQ